MGEIARRNRPRSAPSSIAVGLAATVWMAAAAACGPGGDGSENDAAPASASPAQATAAESPDLAPNARVETHEALVADLRAERHASDGGGRAWLVAATPAPGHPGIVAGGLARFDLVYEAGPLGVAVGGSVLLQTSPFWGWSTPQNELPEAPGYTEVTTRAEGVQLRPRVLDRNLLAIEIAGRPLAAGEQLELRFGAGPAWARVDRFAEQGAAIWFAVDGDGDGVRKLVDDPPRVDVAAGPAVRLTLAGPSVARPGETARLHVAALDAVANAATHVEGVVELEPVEGLELPASAALDASHAGARTVSFRALTEGVYRPRARLLLEDGRVLEAESNPVLVSDSAPRVRWADLHGHSQLSDGTGTPDDYFRYARDVSGLDVVALTDHDHWGMRFLDAHPEIWSDIESAVARHHEPGRFVALLGFEWTSWLHGHRHVLYFADRGRVVSSVDPETETPAGLWKSLAGQPALTFAHHSAGGPVGTNWRYVPPPEIEPVTEVVSVHGSSEALDSPGLIYGPVPGNFVRDVLDRGLRFGFIGSGDGHDGHPGLTLMGSGKGGLAAIFSEEATRDGVRSALLRRRCYATNGPRIWLRFALDGHPMGSTLAVADREEQVLDILVLSPGVLDRVEVVRSGQVLTIADLDEDRRFEAGVELPRLESGEYVYLRAIQQDGGAAWSSPIYVE